MRTSGKQQTRGWPDGQMDATHLTSGRHQSPSHTIGHFPASKPAFNLGFVIYHQNHREREEAQQVISWQGEKKLFECGISAVFWRQNQPGEMHVPRVWLSTLNLPEKRNPKPILQTLVDGKVMEEPQLQQARALTPLFLPCYFGSASKRKNIKVIIWTSLSPRKNIPYSLEK